VADVLYPLTIAFFYLAWVVGAYLVGVTAGHRDFNPLVWGLVSLVISPFIGIVLLTLVTPRTGPRLRP
jgi:predicted branched-subunit amino acid permease